MKSPHYIHPYRYSYYSYTALVLSHLCRDNNSVMAEYPLVQGVFSVDTLEMGLNTNYTEMGDFLWSKNFSDISSIEEDIIFNST